jgi:hypothetical protein
LDENQRVYLIKGLVYMTIPNYMTVSGKAEYLEITHGSNFALTYIRRSSFILSLVVLALLALALLLVVAVV